MQTICRMIQLSPADAASLVQDHALLAARAQAATIYGDVYRYWHAIEYLLDQHSPGSAGARWLAIGAEVAPATAGVPSSRVLTNAQVPEVSRDLSQVEPEDLAVHYDAAAMDVARVYPGTWREWEESFDPLGQVLEHYSFLQEATQQCADAGNAMLFHFELLAEGTV